MFGEAGEITAGELPDEGRDNLFVTLLEAEKTFGQFIEVPTKSFGVKTLR